MKKPKKKARFPLLWVEWLDHYHDATGWLDIADFPATVNTYKCLTVGFLVKEDKTSIQLAQTFAPSDRVSSIMTILKSTIVTRDDLGQSVV